ncbi:hypothetical protein [Candidatus Pantoea persica]|uniref:hypothetical protein n=1 Tax=Candidatus Pantoea persica TaxID=2518128 RepID=UPI00215D79AC|nr:hypothetical protein [Candidatus Pantoea persica]
MAIAFSWLSTSALLTLALSLLANSDNSDFTDFSSTTIYQLRLETVRQGLAETALQLEQVEVETLVKNLAQDSFTCLKVHLAFRIKDNETFSEENYRRRLDAFFDRYPIIGSTTHSLISPVGSKTQLNYVIVDEASQQDILPGIFAFACARNVIVVGGRKQLTHVPVNIPQPADCQRYGLLDSLLHLYGEQVPVTLLREHYRCHPKIIQSCAVIPCSFDLLCC